MPEAAKNYSITELDMCGLTINIASFVHLLKRVDFDVIVDHLAITHIMKSKAEPTTARIKRLLELLSFYFFNLYYIKGKDMILSDFLSRQKTDDSNPHEIIPISFSLRKVLHENYYKLDNLTETAEIETDKYMVQTRSQTKSNGIKVSEVHGIDKDLILHAKPEHEKLVVTPPTCPTSPTHQIQPIDKGLPTNIILPIPKDRIGQGRAGIRRKPKVALPTPKPIQTPAPPILTPAPRMLQSLPEPVVQLQERTLPQHHIPALPQAIVHPTPTSITQPIGPRIEHRPVQPYPDPFLRPPSRPPDVRDLKETRKDLLDLDTDRHINVEENSLHLEGIISEMYERLDKSYIQ